MLFVIIYLTGILRRTLMSHHWTFLSACQSCCSWYRIWMQVSTSRAEYPNTGWLDEMACSITHDLNSKSCVSFLNLQWVRKLCQLLISLQIVLELYLVCTVHLFFPKNMHFGLLLRRIQVIPHYFLFSLSNTELKVNLDLNGFLKARNTYYHFVGKV